MKILGIAASPRKDGNTEFFTQTTLDFLKEKGFDTELILLRHYNVHACIGCYSCMEHKECSQKDDDFNVLFQKMKESQGIILGTPVYYSGVVPNLMCLLDRAGFVGRATGEFFSKKVGGPITVARRAGHNFALAQLLLWFNINDMIVPGSTYWNVGVAGAKGDRDAAHDAEGIATLKHFADNMAFVLNKIHKDD